MRVLTKARIRSEEWKIVMERLDRVNVFMFPMLKFKKWNSFWAPGCTLSRLKRSYYLLRLRLGEFLGESNLQLITKNQIVSFSLFFFHTNEKSACCHGVQWCSEVRHTAERMQKKNSAFTILENLLLLLFGSLSTGVILQSLSEKHELKGRVWSTH